MSSHCFMKVMCLSLIAIGAGAQESVQYGSIGGRIQDSSGGVVPNAKVTCRKKDTNTTNTLMTGSDGRFRFPYLSVGEYEVTVDRTGFGEAARSVIVRAGSAYELPIELRVASSESKVTVVGAADVLETARTQVAGTVSQAEARSLPLNGRNALDLALLVPGVSPTNTASNQLFAETSAVPGQGISVGSQRNFSNSFIVDGLSNNDDAAGLTGAFYGLDTIDELQVVTSGGQAEFGRALGGYINVVTKSGTNTLHGDLYGYFRNQRFNAANSLAHLALPVTQAQYGASAGGPVDARPHILFRQFRAAGCSTSRG